MGWNSKFLPNPALPLRTKKVMRKYSAILCLFLMGGTSIGAQTPKKSIDFYIENANRNSPLQLDEQNQSNILNSEKQYLKNVYMHAQTLLTGNYLFVPIVEKTNGATSFKWNAQSADNYYGYDLGVSNGNLQGSIVWTKPLLGKNVYDAAESQINVQQDILTNNIRLNHHDIQRNVIDQYILCLLDKKQMILADSISQVLASQENIISRLAYAGQAKQSDVQMIKIERKANDDTKASCMQSYHSHLMELNALCCIRDTAIADIEDIKLHRNLPAGESGFLTKYHLDSISAVRAQRMYETKYKPQLNLFTTAGMQTTHYDRMYKNFGVSAGLTFSMLLSDGKLKKIKQHETDATLASIEIYKKNLLTQNEIRSRQCIATINDLDLRIGLLNTQIEDYNKMLDMSIKEIRAGQMSVFDYITVLKNIISVQQQKMTLDANRQLVINAYNYYNW